MLQIAQKLYVGRKVIYVRCISCSYNNVAKSIRLLDKKQFLIIQENFHASKSFWKIYPLNRVYTEVICLRTMYALFSFINKFDQIQCNFGIPEWEPLNYSGKVHMRLKYSYPLEIGKKYMHLSKHMITGLQ